MTDKPETAKPAKRPASRYDRKQRQAVEAGHARHNPPVSWCPKCQ